MALDTNQQMLIEQRVTNDGKSTGVAYLLWFFLGMVGGHRFYLGKTGTAVVQLILTVVGWLTVAIVVGFFVLGAMGLWVLIDAFFIPGMVASSRNALRRQLQASMS